MSTSPTPTTFNEDPAQLPTVGGVLPVFGTDDAAPSFSIDDSAPTEIPAQTQNSFSIDVPPSPDSPPLSGKAAEVRAAKTHFALGDESPGMEALLGDMAAGNERSLRERLAESENIKMRAARVQAIQDKAAQGQPVTPEDFAYMAGLSKVDPKTDPDTIIEKKFGSALVTSLMNLNDPQTNPVLAAFRQNPEGLTETADATALIAARQEVIRNLKANMEAVYADQSWGGWIVDQLKDFVPFYSSYKLGWGSPNSTNFLPGNVIQSKVDYYFSLPIEQMKKELRAELNMIAQDNPGKAKQLADAMLSHTSTQQFLGNIFEVANVALTPGVPALVKGVAKAGAKALGKEAVEEATTKTATTAAGKAATTSSSETLGHPVPQGFTRYFKVERDKWGPNDQKSFDFTFPEYTKQPSLFDNLPFQTKLDELPAFVKGKPPESMSEMADRLRAKWGINDQLELDLSAPRAKGQDALDNAKPGSNLSLFGADDLKQPPKAPAKPAGEVQGPSLPKYPKPNDPDLYNHADEALAQAANDPRSKVVVVDFNHSTGEIRTTAFDANKHIPKAAAPEKEAMKAAIVANADPEPNVGRMLNAVGDVKKGSELIAMNKAAQVLQGADPTGNIKDLLKEVFSIFAPNKIVQEHGPNLGAARTANLLRLLEENAEKVAQAVVESVKVGRLPEEALQAAIQETSEKMGRDLKGLEDVILDISNIHPNNTLANVGSVTYHLGDKGMLPFNSAVDAYHTARNVYRLNTGEFKVNQYGTGYAIDITRTLDETTDAVRNKILLGGNETKKGFASMVFGWLRSADDRVAPFQIGNRQAAIAGRAQLEAAFRQVRDSIGRMSKDATAELDLVMKKNKFDVDVVTGERGKFYDTVAEFEQAFHQLHKKPPTEQQTAAYFTYRQINDWDWVMRNLGVYRDRARMGIQDILIKDVDTGAGKTFNDTFNGKILDKMPWGSSHDAGVLIHEAGKTPRYMRLASLNMDAVNKAEIERLTQEGFKIIQIENPTRPPLQGRLGNETVNFIISKDIEVRPLSWKQIPYRPGWHTEYPQNFFVKQPKLRRAGGEDVFDADGNKIGTNPQRHIYEGDTAMFGFETQAEANKYAAAMERARQAYLSGGNLSQVLQETGLPFTRRQFVDLFEKEEFDKAGRSLGTQYDKNVPFFAVTSGKTTTDLYLKQLQAGFSGFEDTVRSPWNLFANVDKKFAGQRDNPLWTVSEAGSELNPTHKLINATELDPILSVQRAMGQILRARQMADYKISHMEAWIEQFGHLIKGATPEELRSNPVYWLHNGTFVESDLANREAIRAAADSRRALLELVGTPSELQSMVDTLYYKMLDQSYERFGQTYSNKWADLWRYKLNDDAASMMRKAAFHTTIGLFNPAQYIQNAMTMFHAIAIAGPTHGFMGAAAMWPARIALGNEGALPKAAQIATSFGWKEKEFVEMFQELKRSGKSIVEGEHTWISEMHDPNIVQTRLGNFLDAGTVFFREGERATRITAFAAAYKEWRAANPTAVIDDAIRRQLLERTDLMTANMTRASNASWQQGMMSIPAQFLSYHTRLAEQVLGSRLTPAEKARIVAMNSLLYGVPVGVLGSTGLGALAGGQGAFPETLREQLLKRGFTLDDTTSQLLMTGMVGGITSLLTGQPTDVSKLGPSGGSLLKDLFFNDKPFAEALFGASGSKTVQVAESLDPVAKWIMSPFLAKEDRYPLRPEDFTNIIRNVKSVDSALSVYYTAMYGKRVAKNGQVMMDQNVSQAIMEATTGAQPQKFVDAMLKQGLTMERSELVKRVQNVIANDVDGMFDAIQRGDTEVAETYRKRIAYQVQLADLTYKEQAALMQVTTKKHRNRVDQINWDFITKAPASQGGKRLDNFLNQPNK